VLSVEPDDRPVDLGLVIDSSGSMRDFLAESLEVARQIVANRRSTDEFFVERFISSDQIQILQDFTSDGDAVIGSLRSMRVEGGQSAIIDGLYAAADHLALHKQGDARHRALILLSDGEARNSLYKIETLLKVLRAANIQVFTIGFTSELDQEAGYIRKAPREKAETLLKTLAEETGGRTFFRRDTKDVIKATSQIVTDLRSQFRITYQSSSDVKKKGFRKVEVKLKSPDGEKRTAIVPRGYYVGQ